MWCVQASARRGPQQESGMALASIEETASNVLAYLTTFPTMGEQDMEKDITLGPYQIKLAKEYSIAHLKSSSQEGTFAVDVTEESRIPKRGKKILRVHIQSRHRTSKQYYLWVEWDPKVNGSKSVTGWYCMCKAGMRTVGCCAHIAAVIWYLAIARYDKHKFLRACNVSMEDIIDSRSIGDLPEGDNEADEGGAYEADEGDVSEEDQEGGIEQGSDTEAGKE